MQGGRVVHKGGKFGQGSGEGETLGVAPVHHITLRDHRNNVTVEVDVPEDGGHGIIIAQGGRFGGWALYVYKGMPCYDYNFLGMQRFTVFFKNGH